MHHFSTNRDEIAKQFFAAAEKKQYRQK